MAEKNVQEARARNWWFVFYPDSAPKNWKQIIEEWHCEAYVSPLHDRDLNGDNSLKKPHWHIVLCFSGKKSMAQIQALSDELSGVKLQRKINIVKDRRVSIRYLIHQDNPEKAQYDISDICEFGNADVLQFFSGEKDDDKAIAEMMAWCRDNQCYSFAMFANYCADNNIEWFRILHSKKSYFMDKYIKSLGYTDRPNY